MTDKQDEQPQKPKTLRIGSPLIVTEAAPFVVEQGQSVVVQEAATFTRPRENHPVYAKIGHVASDWSHVEHVLDLLIWELTGGDERLVAASTAQMNGICT